MGVYPPPLIQPMGGPSKINNPLEIKDAEKNY